MCSSHGKCRGDDSIRDIIVTKTMENTSYITFVMICIGTDQGHCPGEIPIQVTLVFSMGMVSQSMHNIVQ